MNKEVTIKINEKGWEMFVQVGENLYEEKGVMQKFNDALNVKGVLDEDAAWMSDPLFRVLSENFFCYQVANALIKS
ncbi:hypothetical protein CN432_24105 [Bacillus thuringiensis]|uniref:hypothetical protein n=1 Tax=Bacillus thuringiensis TaxID=1428 RepID=UPI000BF9CC66|nr:hypothetical protein [Bacillus thuringiensis]PEV42101.1 hypothetical protein CN432_24105 [Bacillus thuringiensis]